MSSAVVAADAPPRTRWGLLAVAGAAIVAGLGYAASEFARGPSPVPMMDFVEYWAAAVVTLRGGNPYDGGELLPLQRAATGDAALDQAVMMWNPPPALALVAPLGLLPAAPAHLLFVLAQLGCLAASATWLWRVYGGPPDRVWVAWLLALFAGPSIFLLLYGQIGGLLLLGLAGFLRFRDTRPAVAGMFAALTAIKPHLLFAFGLVLVLDALVSRRGRVVLLAGAAAIGVAALAAWAINPAVYHHYASAGWVGSSDVHNSPKDWYQPLASYWLRRAIDPDRFWIQFVPTVVTAAAVAVYWVRRRRAWDWAAETPRLVFASVLTAAYGAWIFDLVVLLVPAVAVAARLADRDRRTALPYALAVVALSLLTVFSFAVKEWFTGSAATGLHLFVWFAPAAFALYAVASAYTLPRTESAGGGPWRTAASTGW